LNAAPRGDESIQNVVRFVQETRKTQENIPISEIADWSFAKKAEQLKRKACSAGVLNYAKIGGENHSRILDAAISRQVTNSNSAALPSSVTLRARLKAATI